MRTRRKKLVRENESDVLQKKREKKREAMMKG